MYYTYMLEKASHQLGVQELYPWQQAPFEAILSARNVFAMAPTAGGKSLLYQLPALIGDGLTIAVSPLKALQLDQVRQLQAKGCQAEVLNSDLSRSERQAVLEKLPSLQLLYLAPEQLDCDDLRAALANCRVARLAVDEAHILPEAMLGFRKSYGRIGDFLSSLPKRPQVIACTATATPKVRKQILQALGAPDAEVFTLPVRRENLHLQIKKINGGRDEMYHAVERTLRRWRRSGSRKERGSAIIYCTTVKDVKRLHKYLKARDWHTKMYTGKTPQKKRQKTLEAFLSGEAPVVIATNAFGLGINKSDVRLVIHAGMPLGMNGYVQEIGRAGRDGRKAHCVLFYTKSDYGRNKSILNHGSRKAARQGIKDLDALMNLLRSRKCLWCGIERYFGEKPGKRCKHCCRCKHID